MKDDGRDDQYDNPDHDMYSRSNIVHLDKITSIRRDLVVVGKAELPVSDSYHPHLEELLRLSSLSARQKGAGDNDPEHR